MTPVSKPLKRTTTTSSRWLLSSTILTVSTGIIGACVYQGTVWFGERLLPAAPDDSKRVTSNTIIQTTAEISLSVTRQLQGFLNEKTQVGFIGKEEEPEEGEEEELVEDEGVDEFQVVDNVPGNDFSFVDEDSDANTTKSEVDLLSDVDLGTWENGFQIKLYWEEGYKWQNETRERKCKLFTIYDSDCACCLLGATFAIELLSI